VTGAIDILTDLSNLDAALAALPNCPAVFLIWPSEGEPYLSKTGMLRRRLLRLLKERERPSRLLNLRHTARRIEYWLTASALESSLLFYQLARQHFPETYRELMKLRLPPYVKLVLSNQFPRSQVTSHLSRSGALFFGPFRSRASAERFESQFLDLFQIRRCQEDLAPSPDHPGCMYGEMGMCLRPCQQVVGAAEYGHEVTRVTEFLRSDGHSLLDSIAHSRDRLSEEMQFEEAARLHKRYEKVRDVLKLRDELARELESLSGVAVTRSSQPGAVELWFVVEGHVQPAVRLTFEVKEGKPAPLDAKLHEIYDALGPERLPVREREETLALLARWFYSSWRDGEWLDFETGAGGVPYRKLVHAISRVASGKGGVMRSSRRNSGTGAGSNGG
jgi:excinuclease UvrABC nuclease subunit